MLDVAIKLSLAETELSPYREKRTIDRQEDHFVLLFGIPAFHSIYLWMVNQIAQSRWPSLSGPDPGSGNGWWSARSRDLAVWQAV